MMITTAGTAASLAHTLRGFACLRQVSLSSTIGARNLAIQFFIFEVCLSVGAFAIGQAIEFATASSL